MNTLLRLNLILVIFFAHFCLAEIFENSYISFELPERWSCEQIDLQWACSPDDPRNKTQAIIVIAAKVAGPEDNLQAFEAHLKRPKMLTTTEGTPVPSKVMHAKPRRIGNQVWVEGLHLSSEVKDFFTLYLATKIQNLSIMVSFSADRRHAANYNADFARTVRSLKLVATQNLVSGMPPNAENASGLEGSDTQLIGLPLETPKSGFSLFGFHLSYQLWTLLALFVGLVSAIFYFLIKR